MSTGCLNCLALEERIATLQVALSSLMAMHDNSAAASRLERVVQRFEGRARHVIPGTMSLDDLWAWAERIETFIEGKKKPDKQTDGE